MEYQANPSPNIAIMGATGKVGSQIINALSREKIPAKALSRKAARLEPVEHITWMQGDIENQESIKRFLDGVDKLFLNSGVSEQMVEQQCSVIDIARSSGVRHIIKLSTPEARKPSKSRTGEWHWEIQEYLKHSGVHWNSLQPQSFMQNWTDTLAPSIKAERKIYSAAGEGKRAFTDTRDIARVAVTLFREPGTWIDAIIPLSGGSLVSYRDIAEAFTKALNEKVEYIAQSPEEARQRMLRQGMPAFMAEVTLMVETNQKLGLVEHLLTDNVEKITGKKPYTIEQFAEDYIAYFK
ncbi:MULTISPECIES: NmrA family NAD(P)-binding protein [Chryseobacterium]|uniref:Uncharacterized protein YbjT (DUF2867 family) n=1 Tax=Chryseobacterium camelliae TaxID=1265445 RepID=A0ABU0TEL3_9FLAO|nr:MULTISPECIES: NmrA family NAD(P)-binding protein [Chryseobacterium]MDT3406941.1 uncharacterized protein YbjT (DUF2867 family) [Pseudacidovorax intermedius]MDQ1095266.1 uncharacterized protein YbjT (DUF2867 family) [Chryseobacterium camelliae]MDQ1099204.1 uncharacterized protein YbjT (DUF2867 family) [Chryseobacterium sp. SORGH_AS_1048]MDR6086554.1 uncharacterized protein YbjT (DUF2867 family) [Chryseobacterium sp. SORGH_AS_0909]MDR6130924.1 uncharacterized protein YbjT (DUF2867 family) [Chr